MSGIAGTILSTIALPLNVIGLAIPYWQYYGTFLGQIHWGLWQMCAGLTFGLSGSSGHSACETLDSAVVPDSLKAVRALELLGMILMCAAIVCAAIKLCVRKDKLVFFQAAGGLAILAGIVMLIGTIVYGVKTKNEMDFFGSSLAVSVFDLHAGFGLCITAGCLAIIAGFLFLCDRREQQNSQPGMVFTTTQPGPVPYQVPYASANYNVGSQGAVISVAQPAPYPGAGYSAGYAKTSTPY